MNDVYISIAEAIRIIDEASSWHPECAHVLGPMRCEFLNHEPADVVQKRKSKEDAEQ